MVSLDHLRNEGRRVWHYRIQRPVERDTDSSTKEPVYVVPFDENLRLERVKWTVSEFNLQMRQPTSNIDVRVDGVDHAGQ